MLSPQYVNEVLREGHPQEDMNWLTVLFMGTINDEISWLMKEMSTGGEEGDFSILEDINILGSKSWGTQNHQEAKDLLKEFTDIFSKHDLDLGVTSLWSMILSSNLRWGTLSKNDTRLYC